MSKLSLRLTIIGTSLIFLIGCAHWPEQRGSWRGDIEEGTLFFADGTPHRVLQFVIHSGPPLKVLKMNGVSGPIVPVLIIVDENRQIITMDGLPMKNVQMNGLIKLDIPIDPVKQVGLFRSVPTNKREPFFGPCITLAIRQNDVKAIKQGRSNFRN